MKEISKASKVWLEIMKLAKENDIDLSTIENITVFLKRGFKDVIEGALAAEFDDHMGYEKNQRSNSSNARNGTNSKQIKAALVNLISSTKGWKKHF